MRRHPPRHGPLGSALEPIRQGVRQHFGGFAKAITGGLSVRHDYGSQYMSERLPQRDRLSRHRELARLRPGPEGNGCAERFIRTLKENLLWVRTFATVEEVRQVLLKFGETYDTAWLIERHGFITREPFASRVSTGGARGVGFNKCPNRARGQYRSTLSRVVRRLGFEGVLLCLLARLVMANCAACGGTRHAWAAI